MLATYCRTVGPIVLASAQYLPTASIHSLLAEHGQWLADPYSSQTSFAFTLILYRGTNIHAKF